MKKKYFKFKIQLLFEQNNYKTARKRSVSFEDNMLISLTEEKSK